MAKQWIAEFADEWQKEKPDKNTVAKAAKFGQYLAVERNKLTTSQLRKFFGEVKRLQMRGYKDNESDFIMLKPKLAYAVGRAKKDNKIHDFYHVLADGIDKVNNAKEFKNFIKIFEAIVAYHKAAEESNLITNSNI